MRTVSLLHVSATHAAIFREVHYKGQMHVNITAIFQPMHRCKILDFKIILSLKYTLKINMQIKSIVIDSNV